MVETNSSSVDGKVNTEEGDEILLSHEPLSESDALQYVRSPSAGATCVFVGTTRNTFEGKQVINLSYEAYSKLALRTISSIVARARAGKLTPPVSERNGHDTDDDYGRTVTRIHISHRLGVVPVGECSIIIAVSSPHRRESFEVAEWLLEQVKREVPIWKQEVYNSGVDPAWKANFG